MSSRRSGRPRGFTLVETIVAVVIIGVGLAGVLAAFNVTVRSNVDPLIHKQMLAIAEEMMEEIQLKPYAPGSGAISGCDRSQADDVADYAGYHNRPVCDIDGLPVPSLSDYRVSVSLADIALGEPGVPAKRIEVTVSRGGEAMTLVGWRTDYAS